MRPLNLLPSFVLAFAVTSVATQAQPVATTGPPVTAPTRVVVVFAPLDEEFAEGLVKSSGRIAVESAGLFAAGGAATVAASGGYAGTAAVSASLGAVILPLTIIFGGGALAGSAQQRNAEIAAAQALTDPLRERFTRQHREQALDQAFVSALDEELVKLAWLQREGATEVMRSTADEDGDAPDVDDVLKSVLGKVGDTDRRQIMFVLVRDGLPASLSAYAAVAEVRLYPPRPILSVKNRLNGRTETKLRSISQWAADPSRQTTPRALALSPVPLADLFRKPKAWIDAQEREIEAHYAPLIETANRDTRRELRTRRNAELDRVHGPWRLLQLSQHMVPAWQGPEGDLYTGIVRPGLQAFAKSVVTDLEAAPADAR